MKSRNQFIIKRDDDKVVIDVKFERPNAYKDEFLKDLNSILSNIADGLQKKYHFSEVRLK